MNETLNKFINLSGRELEDKIDYRLFYRPKDGFVGDVIPYYENGVFYIFYLKDQGDSYNHSIFLVETKDFIHYEEKGKVLEATKDIHGQDDWVGTGSICKVENRYYLFYTGHNNRLKTQEKVMIAISENDLYHFKKIDNFYIEPLKDLSHRDFRDPDSHYDKENDRFYLSITSNSPSKGRLIAKYILSRDLSSYEYVDDFYVEDKEVFDFKFYNFECSDIFKISNNWYLSFSCQDDCLYVIQTNELFSFSKAQGAKKPIRLDGKYFYVPKMVNDDKNTYMVGWARSKHNHSDDNEGNWGGNLLTSKITMREDGSVYLSPIDKLDSYFVNDCISKETIELNKNNIIPLCPNFESFKIEGSFKIKNKEEFGFVFGLGKEECKLGKIRIRPNKEKIEFSILGNKRCETYIEANIEKNKEYHFTLISEGSVAVFYIDNIGALTTRFYENLTNEIGLYSINSIATFSNINIKRR